MLKREPSSNSIGSDGNTSFLRAARAGHLDKVLEHLKSNIDINTSNTNGLNALHLASKDGHVDVVAELLKRGAVVDAATKKGNTALHIASLAGQEEVVKLLVQHGASVNVQSQNGFTPLYMAAQENHDNVVKYLLANGANQSLATEDGFTPLAVAMQQGHDKVVTVLLENDTRGKVRLPALHIAAKKDDVKAAKLLLENEHNPDVTSKSGFTPLHIASHYGNEAIANLLIHKGADVNYAAKHNITPLHVAAKWGKTNMVALLLEHGANIESKTRDGLTPLHCAARSGHEQVVDMLLERGAPISCKTKNGLAPLHMAGQGDHIDAARILLYHRAPVDEVTVDYLTALHVAAHCGHVRVAKLLLDRQADANARALNGFTPLHIACKKNRIKVVELLLKHGASIGATTESGLTPLHVASFMGCMNIVIYLLQHDANPDVPTVRGETPLHLAARANQTDIIRILLRNGAQVDARAREQQTPLHIASRLGNVDIVMLLLQHGAKVDTTTKDMYTALHIAAKEGQDEVAAVLIENGASLNATTKKGFTPLHLAAKYGNIKVAKLLLQKEAPVDAQGKNGVTPLHVASHYDHQNVALLLLDKGASPHATAKNGHTPLHIAARKNQMDIANTLLEYGAKPNAESKAGFTPLHLSSQEGHTDMSSLLIEHEANTNYPAKNGLTPLHLCAQEDRVPVAEILVKNGAEVDASTKGGFTPLHIASHYGQANMVRFLLANGADVCATTSLHYTPLHQAAQQGHTNIVNILLESSAQPNSVTLHGQTPLHIAQKLGYISVIETLKVVTETTTTTITVTVEEKYKVVAPEAMQETFMSDSEEEGGEDTVLGDHSYRYLTADEMKSLGDDSLPIDVTRDERIDSNKMVTSEEQNALPPQAIEDGMSPQYITENYVEYTRKYIPDNVDIARHPINIGFLVSFLVDARGGAMRGCRHSGVRVIVPPRCAPSPTRITCRYVRPQRTPHPPPLMEGEALASRVLELGPVGAKFLGPVIIEVPHFAALRGKEREIVILRSDNGETWREHTVDASEDILNEVLTDSFEAEDLSQLEDISSGRITRVVTHDFPQYFAIVTRIRQEVHAIGPEGGMVSSTVVPQVQAVFPQGALTKKIKVGLQAQPIDPELTAKLLGHGVAVSPVVTVEPRRRKFHKAITLSMPAPRAHSQGMINQYSGNAPTLRLLCSITGGTTRAQWEDVTGSTPLTFVNDCVSFTTTVSARFWLMDCRNIGDATKMATELYKEAIHVPFMAKFVVFAKRIDPLEARLRVFCMTDDKEDKTLEHQEHFTEVAKSRDVEVLEGKPQYIEFAGNLVPITKSGEPLQFSFRAFRENRLPFSVRVKDQHAEAVGRCLFMREPKVAKGEPPQQPICILNIVLPDDIVSETVTLTDNETFKRHMFLKDNFDYYRPDPRLADMSNLLGEDWVPLATQLGLTPSEINVIKSEYPDSVAKQAQSMLRMWISQSGNKAQGDALENALMRIGREDIIPQCLNADDVDRIPRIPERYHKDIDAILETTPSKQRETYESKYSAEEKVVEEPSDEEDFNKSVSERRQQIEKRLTERNIPASAQRQEIVEEITSIKRQSMVEDKIAEVETKHKPEQTKTTTMIKTVTTDVPDTKKMVAESVETTKTTTTSDYQPDEVTIRKQFMEEESPDRKTTVRTIITEKRTIEHIPTNEIPLYTDRRDSDLLEGVTQRLETTRKATPRISTIDDPNSPKLSKTPPPSPADFIFREQAAVIQGWNAPNGQFKDKPTTPVAKEGAAMQGIPTTTAKHLASSEELSLDSPQLERSLANDNDTLRQKTNAFIDIESRRELDNNLDPAARESRLPKPDEKTKTISRDSSREDTSRGDEKKSKKGFFGTLKSIVGKSQDRSDSESEKSQKKEKRKEKKREKKKKVKLPREKPPLEPPERPPRKPKLPTPPPQPHEPAAFDDIPYVEASPTDHVNGIEDDVQITDLDATNEVPEHVKSAANDLVSEIITTSETKALDILEGSPTVKRTIIREEIKREIEPKIYDIGEFRVIVSPSKGAKAKDYFKLEVDETIEAPELPGEIQPESPVRPQRRKEHIYEEIAQPDTVPPPTKLILYDTEPVSDIKMLTTNLIQSEINFAGWSDDKHNVYKPSEIKEKEHTLPRTGKRHGRLFGFLAKKSSKDVDESDNEKEFSKEIIEKQDREPSKERVLKADGLSDEEGVDQKKGGFFGIFGKKSKKEDDHKEVIEKDTEIPTSTEITETAMRKSPEGIIQEDLAAPAEKTDASPEPQQKDKRKPKKEKVLSESEDESEHKKSGLFGFFTKKGKKDKEEQPKTIQISESVVKDMNDTTDFLQNEIKHFEDVKIFSPKRLDTSIVSPPEKLEEIDRDTAALVTSKPPKPEVDKSATLEREKTPTKMKKQKQRPEKRESSVSEDESEGRKSGIFGLFGKKHKKGREKSPKIPDDVKPSEEVLQQMKDTNDFLRKEVDLFDDVKPVNGYLSSSSVDEPAVIKERVSLKDVVEPKAEHTISKDTKVEHIIIKETSKLDPITKEEVITSGREIIRETITTHSIITKPIAETQAKPVEDLLAASFIESPKTEKIQQQMQVQPLIEISTLKPEDSMTIPIIDDKITSTNFLKDEIEHFNDVKVIATEPLLIQDVKTKGKKPVTPKMDKKKSEEGEEPEDESESSIKGGFFSFFSKKSKIEEGKGKKQVQEVAPKKIFLSGETVQNMTDSKQFLSNEILSFEDVRPIIKEEKIMVETPTVEVETKTPPAEAKIDPKSTEKAKEVPEIIAKPRKKKDKKEKLETQSQESLQKERKSGFFDIFSKKGKKDDKIKVDEEPAKEIKLSDEVIKDMQVSNDFLTNEVTNFHDVKPIVIEEEIAKIKIEKPVERLDTKQVVDIQKSSEEPLILMAQTNDFLIDEIRRFDDVKIIKTKPIQEEGEQILVDIPTAKVETKTSANVTAQTLPGETKIDIKQKELVKEISQEVKEKPKKKDKKEKLETQSQESLQKEKKSGFFDIFSKKAKKDDKVKAEEEPVKETKLSDEVIKDMHVSNDFLANEVTNFHDVKPIIIEETIEKIKIEKPISGAQKTSEETLVSMVQTNDFLKDEIRRFDDVKIIKTKPIKEEDEQIVVEIKTSKELVAPTLPPEVKIDVKQEELVNEPSHDIKEKPKKKDRKEKLETQSQESLQKERKSGFFDIFSKKGKKDHKVKFEEEPKKKIKLSDEVQKDMKVSDDFLTNEVTNFHDVKAIVIEEKIEKIKIEKPVEKLETKPISDVEKTSEEALVSMAQTSDFLKDEIQRFDDVKIVKTEPVKETGEQILIEIPTAKVEMKDVAPTLSTEAKIDTKQIEKAKVPEITAKPRKKKDKKEKLDTQSQESLQKERKSGFFDIFGKKGKKDHKVKFEEGPTKETKLSDEVLKDMKVSDDFLTNEVTNFHDVKPIITEEKIEKIKIEKPIDKLETKPISDVEKTSEEPLVSVAQTSDFLKDEIQHFDDVKIIKAEPKLEKVEAPPKPDTTKDVKIVDSSTLEKTKSKKEKLPIGESDSQKKVGFFGLFSKKPKKGEKPLDKSELSEEAIKNSEQFLSDEVSFFEDVRPIIEAEKAQTKIEMPSEIPTAQTEDFLKEEIERFHDVKQALPETRDTAQKFEVKPTHIIKERIVVRADLSDEEIRKILEETDHVKFDDKTKTDIEEEAEKKGGYFGLFSKKSKKDKPESESSEETLKNIDDTNQFLNNEITVFGDVRPIIKPDITEAPITKIKMQPQKAETDEQFPHETEEAKLQRAQTDNFLKEEIQRFHDVKELLPHLPPVQKPKDQREEAKAPDFLEDGVQRSDDVKQVPLTPGKDLEYKPKPTHIIKETIVVRGDLSDEDLKKILDETDLITEDVIIRQQVTLDDQKKTKQESKLETEETDEKKKSGFFGFFSKKSKKEEKEVDDKPSEEVVKIIENCDEFLTKEINLFEDVRPIIKPEITEAPIVQSAKSSGEYEDPQMNIVQTIDFLKEEVDRFHDVRQVSPKSPAREDEISKLKHPNIKEAITAKGDAPDKETEIEEFTAKKQAKLDAKKKKHEPKTSAEDEEKKKSGFFGLFGKKHKKEEKQPDGKPSEEAIKAIENCDTFLTKEIALFEDVRPVIKQEIIEAPREVKIAERTEKDEDPKFKIEQTVDFLKEEIDGFQDMKQILPSKLKPTHIIKETIIVKGDITDEEINKILEENDQIKEAAVVKKQGTLDSKKNNIEEPKESTEEIEEKTKTGFFGLFGKKHKKEDKQIRDQSSEEALKAMENCEDFLTSEVALFEDVRPIIKKEIPATKTETKKSEAPKETAYDHEEAKRKIVQTANFLEDEVQRFDDVKQVLPKSPVKGEKATHIIKETIIIRSDLPDEEIIKILDDSDRIQSKLDDKRKSTEELNITTDEPKEHKRSGFFGLFGKKSKKEDNEEEKVEEPAQEKAIKISEKAPEKLISTDTFLKDEVTYFEDVRPVVISTPPTIEKPPGKPEKKTDSSEEYIQNLINTTNFLADEVKYFEDVKPIIKETILEKVETIELSPKKGKKKKGKRESSESGDESDESRKSSGLFKLFGKKGKKDKNKEDKLPEEVASEDTKSKSSTLESVKKVTDKTKPERRGSQKKVKKEKSEEDSSKSLFGIFGKKDKVSAEVPKEPAEIIISEVALKDMRDSSDFLSNEINKFDDVKESKATTVKYDLNLDGKLTIAEITKTLEPKTYEGGHFKVIVSPTGEPKRREFSVTLPEPTEHMEKQTLPTTEQTVTTLITEVSIPARQFDEQSQAHVIKIPEKATPQIELSQEVLKYMIDTSNFLNQEISMFYDVKPIIREKTPLSEGEESKDKKKRKKKQRQKSIEDDSSRKSGFFGLFGKRDKKSESPESGMDIKSSEEQVLQETTSEPEIKSTSISKEVPVGIDFVESVHMTNNFLNDEIKNYHDVKPIIARDELAAPALESKPEVPQREPEQKAKSRTLFGLFGKKSEEQPEDQQPKKETTMKEKRERRKSGSPFRIFSKKSKEEDKPEEIKPVISEQTLQNMYETKNFLSTEVMRYNDAPYKSGDKPIVEIKKTVAFLDDAVTKIPDIESTVVATTTIIAKEITDDGKVRIGNVFKEIKEDLQPTEKVIVVIKDEVLDTTRSIKEMECSPGDIISEIAASIPADATIKEIYVETVEEDSEPVILTHKQLDELTRDSRGTIDTSVPPNVENYQSGFLNSERSFADVDIENKQTKREGESGETVDLPSRDSKKDAKKDGKKSGGFFSKLIPGKSRQAKDEIISDVNVTLTEATEISESEIDKVIKKAEDIVADTQETQVEIPSHVRKFDVKTVEDNLKPAILTQQMDEYLQGAIEQRIPINLGGYQVQGLLDSERLFADATISDKPTQPEEDINRQFQEITNDVLELTKELDTTVELLEDKASSEKEDSKKDPKKTGKKSVGFFSKLIPGKSKQTKGSDTEEDGEGKKLALQTGQLTDATDKKITKDLKKVEVPDEIEIPQTETETRDMQKIQIEIPQAKISAVQEPLQKLDETKPEIAITPESAIKSKSKKAARKSGGFFGKMGDKFSSKAKDVKGEGKHLMEQVDDKLSDIEGDLNKSEDQILQTSEDIATTISGEQTALKKEINIIEDTSRKTTGEIVKNLAEETEKLSDKLDKDIAREEEQIADYTARNMQDAKGEINTLEIQLKDAISQLPHAQDQTQEFIDDMIKTSGIEGREVKSQLEAEIPKDTIDISDIKSIESPKKRAKKPRKKSGGFFSKIGDIFTDKGESPLSVEETAKIKDGTDKAESLIPGFVKGVAADTSKKAAESADEFAKQTEGVISDLQDKAKDEIKEASVGITGTSEMTKAKAKSTKQTSEDTIKDATSEIAGFFGGLGIKAKDIKKDASDKVEHIGTSAEQTRETIEKTWIDSAKETEEFLKEFKDETTDSIKYTTDKIKEEKSKLSEKTNGIIASASEIIDDAKDKMQETAKEDASTIEQFFGGLGEKAKDAKDDTLRKMEHIGANMADSTKQAGDSIQQTAINITQTTVDEIKGERDAMIAKSDEIATTASEISKEKAKSLQQAGISITEDIKEGVEASTKKVLTGASEAAKHTSDSINQTGEAFSKDTTETVKESTEKIGGFFDIFGRDARDFEDAASDEMKRISANIADSIKQAGESIERTTSDLTEKTVTASKSTVDKLKEDRDKAVEKSSEVLIEASKETEKSVQEVSGAMVEGIKEGVTTSAKKIEDTRIKASENIDTTLTAASEAVEDKTGSVEQKGEALSKDAKDIAEETADNIGGFFNMFGKRVIEKTADISDTTKQAAKSLEQTTTDLTQKADEAVSDTSENAVDVTKSTVVKIKEERDKATEVSKEKVESVLQGIEASAEKIKDDGSKIIAKTGATISSASETAKDNADFLQQKGEILSKDAKDATKENADKIGGFFGMFGEKAKDVKDHGLDQMKHIGVGIVDSTKQAGQTLEKTTTDVVKQTGQETAVDQLKDQGDKAIEKSKQILTTTSELCKEEAQSVQQSGEAVFEDIKEGVKTSAETLKDGASKIIEKTDEQLKEGADTIGDFFSMLGTKTKYVHDDTLEKMKHVGAGISESTKKAGESIEKSTTDVTQRSANLKDDASNKIKQAGGSIGDQTEKAVISVGKTTTDFAKKTEEFLEELRGKTTETAEDALEKGKQEAAAIGEVVFEAGKVTEKHVKDTGASVGEFFSDIGTKTKDKFQESGISDKTERGIKSTEEVSSDFIKQTGNFLDHLRDDAFTVGGEAIKEVEKGTNRVEFLSNKDFKQDLTGKTQDSSKQMLEPADLTDKIKVLERNSDTLGTAKGVTTEEVGSAKQAGGTLSEDALGSVNESISRIGAFFDDLGRRTGDAKYDVSVKVQDISASVADGTKQSFESFKGDTAEFLSDPKDKIFSIGKSGENVIKDGKGSIKETTSKMEELIESLSKKSKDVKDDVIDTTKSADDKLKKGSEKIVRETSDFLGGVSKTADAKTETVLAGMSEKAKGVEKETKEVQEAVMEKSKESGEGISDLFGGISKTTETVLAGMGAIGKDVETKTKEVQDSVAEKSKETGQGISGLFGGFGKRKGKKVKSVEEDADVKMASQPFSGETDKFLFEERIQSAEEYRKAPVVTSPTLPRRVASHRIARGDVPYFIEVTNLTYEDSSSDESYIVTEPTEKFSARISDESAMDSGRKRRPLFHIESEEDPVELGRRGSIKSNILETLSAQQLETLITDLDEIDDTVPTDTRFTSNVIFEDKDAKSPSQVETDIIERKLSDIEKALGTLEQAETVEPVPVEKPSLKRVERKFERMASELMAENAEKAKDSTMTTPEMEEHNFRRIVSQISTEEISDCQKEYAALWDEQTFSPSEGCDTSKTPDSQADVVELPQGEASGVQQKPEQPSAPQSLARAESEETSSQRQTTDRDRPVVDQHMLSDEMKKLLKELEEESKK